MADFSTIKQEIDENIVPFNDAQEITGEKLNVTLTDMVDAINAAKVDKEAGKGLSTNDFTNVYKGLLDAGFQFLGILPEDFNPSSVTPAGKVWYLATPAEYYGIEEIVPSGHIAIMSYDGTDWNFTDYDLIQNGYVDRQTFDNAVYDLIERLDTKVDSVVDSTPDNLPAFDGPNGVLKDSGVSVDDLVKKDGYYDTLGAGYAKTLLGNGAAVDAEFLYRTTGGEASVADGIASLKKLEGNTIGWNQLVDTDTESVSLVSGHKYLTIVGGEASIVTGAGSAIEVEGGTDMVFDLTLMGGLFASLEGDTGVATFRSFFPKPYYPYNAGQLLSVKATGIKTTGVNQFDGTKARVIGGKQYYILGTYSTLKFADTLDGEKTDIIPSSNLYTPASDGYIFATGMSAEFQIAIYHSGGGIPATYHPYEEHLLSLPITSVTGKVNGQGTSEVVFPEGMRSARTAYDELTDLRDGYFHGARKRMIKVNLGDATWVIRDNGIPNMQRFGTVTFSSLLKMPSANNVAFNGICAAFVTKRNTDLGVDTTGTFIAMQANGYLDIRMPSFEGDATAFKAAMNGVYLIAELATPVDYVLDTPIPCNYPAFDWSTEEVQPVGTDEDGVPMTAPIRAGIVYGPNVQDTIRRLPQDYISKESMENLLNALKTAGIISAFTMTFDSASQKYNFSITAPTNE